MEEKFFDDFYMGYGVAISPSRMADYIIPNCRFIKGEIQFIGKSAIAYMEDAGLSIGEEVFYERNAWQRIIVDHEQVFDIVKYNAIIDLVECRTHLKELEALYKSNESKWLKLYKYLEYVSTLDRRQVLMLSELCLFEEHMQNALGDAPDQEVGVSE